MEKCEKTDALCKLLCSNGCRYVVRTLEDRSNPKLLTQDQVMARNAAMIERLMAPSRECKGCG